MTMTENERTLKKWLNRGYELLLKIETRRRHLDRLGGLPEMGKAKEILTYPAVNATETTEIEKSLIKESIDIMEADLLEIDKNTELQLFKSLERGAYYTALYNRYVARLSWIDLAKSMSYSDRHARRLHDEAIEVMARSLSGKTIEYENDQVIIFADEEPNDN